MNRLARLRFFLVPFLLAASSGPVALGCGGGAVCNVSAGSLEGSWVMTFGSGKDTTEIDITIDADGNVSLVEPSPDNPTIPAFENCTTVKSGICDLEVQCTDTQGDTFTLDLVRKK